MRADLLSKYNMASFLSSANSMSEISSPGITSEHVFHTKQLFMTRLQSHSCSYMTLLRYSDDPILPLEDANSIHSMYKHGCT